MHKKNSKKLDILIVGKGSIGLRHANIFKDLGCEVSFFRTNNSNLNSKSYYNEYFTFVEVNKLSFDLIVISNPSSLHVKYLKKFQCLSSNFLIEKPTCTNNKDLKFLKKISLNKNIYSGYMLRYDKRVLEIKKKCKNIDNIKFSSFKWHTYFPDWHKYENFKNSYAAKKNLGGGVIFTCSHEIDIAIFLFGKVKSVLCLENKKKLNLKVEESVNIFIKHTNGINSLVSLDFTNKNLVREFKIFCIKKIVTYNFKKFNIFQESIIKDKIIKISENNNLHQIYRRQNFTILKNIKKNIKTSLCLETEKVLLSCFKSLKLKKTIRLF
jgi:predicted dehydrogenase